MVQNKGCVYVKEKCIQRDFSRSISKLMLYVQVNRGISHCIFSYHIIIK